jgi:molybdenum cofactor synthesis domain-containing protein
MRPIKRLIQLDEALRLVFERTRPVERKQEVTIGESMGRVAAKDVVSRMSVPPFARSAMDGYAVRASDTYGATRSRPKTLRVIEAIYAGTVAKKALAKGQSSEIATGAMLPKGADAVVMVEDTELDGNRVMLTTPVHPGQNVSRKGEDIIPGTKVISKGEVLNPSKIGALAAIGERTALVYAKPVVGIVPTGNEVAPLGSKLGPGQVYNINSYTLAGVVDLNGGVSKKLDIFDDDLESLTEAVKECSDCDIVVFSGGSSVGERDIMLDLLEKEGKVVFHGIAVKPGKPTLFGTIGKQLVFGMPGYPTACLSNAYIMLMPVLRRMARLPENPPASVRARMSKRVVSTTGRTQFLTVRLVDDVAHPAFKESGAITSMAFADGYVVIPADVDLLEKDEEVVVYLL